VIRMLREKSGKVEGVVDEGVAEGRGIVRRTL
jgi:hypothetical protein